MKFTRHVVLITCMASTSTGCGSYTDHDFSESTAALLGATPTTDRPEVAEFFGSLICTATMISSRTFVTAAHCVDFAPIRFGGSMTFLTEGSRPVLHTFSQGGQGGDDDIAVGRLLNPITSVTPATIASSLPNSTLLTAMGYGCTTQNSQDCSPSGRTFRTYSYTSGGGTTNFHTPGDSGGPTFVGSLQDGGPIARVHSGETWSGNDVGANPILFRNHILAMDAALNLDGISYRVQVQGWGWMPAARNNAVAGTTGQSRRLEGLQIWSPRNGISVCYSAYVQNFGWMSEVCNGNLAGTVGQGLRMEAVKIRLAAVAGGATGVEYNTYLEGIGWQGARQNGAVAGTTGQGRRIEAITIRLLP